MIISKELLSEVFGKDVLWLEFTSEYGFDAIEYEVHDSSQRGNRFQDVINIHELAHKCKKWVYGLGYDIKESKNSLVISKFTSTGHERVLIERYKLHGVKPEEIIEGCQYILEQKDKA